MDNIITCICICEGINRVFFGAMTFLSIALTNVPAFFILLVFVTFFAFEAADGFRNKTWGGAGRCLVQQDFQKKICIPYEKIKVAVYSDGFNARYLE